MAERIEITRPQIIVKESDSEKDIAELEKILHRVPANHKRRVERQIQSTKKGQLGEKNVIFELKNCSIPMVCIHNLYLTFEDLTAQIDFIFVTRDKVYVVESKNLYGDITINQRGEFFRVVHEKVDRMYSPLTQCQHHLNVMKLLRNSISKQEFPRYFTEKHYENNFQPLIVIANPSCKLNLEDAPQDIVNKIVHTDQLARYIEDNDNKSNYITGRSMENFAHFYSTYHKENPRYYMKSYRDLLPSKKPAPKKKPTTAKPAQTTAAKSAEKQPEPKPAQPEKAQQKSPQKTPLCPKCQKKLVVREARQGVYAGEKFYGCSGYPQCDYRDYSKETKGFLNKK